MSFEDFLFLLFWAVLMYLLFAFFFGYPPFGDGMLAVI